jgi:HAD superfamily hydrolase (TIGR01509 family)
MIDTIFFDLVGVLLFPKTNPGRNSLRDKIDQRIGRVTDDARFKEEMLCEYDLSENELNQILQSVVDKYEPYAPLWKRLPQLKDHYKLGIINNGTALTYPFFEEKYHLSQKFDVIIVSAIAGVCKPEPAIYLQACQKTGSSPQNCLFMDDSRENITGAQMVGMQTIHWPDRENGFQAFTNRMHDFDGPPLTVFG